MYRFNAPSGVDAWVFAPSAAAASRAFCTTSATLTARGKDVGSDEYQWSEDDRKAAEVAIQHDLGAVVIKSDSGRFKAIGEREAGLCLTTERQRRLQGCQNAMIGDTPMRNRVVKMDDETWDAMLSLGGSRWLRETVRKAAKIKAKK